MSKHKVINTIANRLATAHDKIKFAAQKVEKAATNVKLMAVSKTKPVDMIIEAYNSGQRIFGENYAQELSDKVKQLDNLSDIEWHYIGPIQSNKTKIITESASWIDSVDRLKIAKRINEHAKELGKQVNILIQVNISKSEQKSGIYLEDVAELAAQINSLEHISLRGLMAIPDNYSDRKLISKEFNLMNTCFNELKQQYPSVDTLSLGMSGDLDIAVECGSTMVRIGTDIFGARSTK